jgi:hypothetical protein
MNKLDDLLIVDGVKCKCGGEICQIGLVGTLGSCIKCGSVYSTEILKLVKGRDDNRRT